MTLTHERICTLLALVKQAGQAVQAVYEHPTNSKRVDYKGDNSPLTEADRLAHSLLSEGLAKETPLLPVISEESELPPFSERSAWQQYWLIDPLDGTKEFVERTGDFTVNVALIEAGKPIWGAVYAPVLSTLYWGSKDFGAFKQVGDESPTAIRVQHPYSKPVRALRSRRHGHSSSDLKRYPPLDDVVFESIGSSLKFCLIAEGRADLYARLGPTSEWDTAAAQAVLEAAGGYVVDLDGKPVIYNQRENIVQPFFIALGDDSLLPAAIATFNVHK